MNDPANLSISLAGGKESKCDGLSKGDRKDLQNGHLRIGSLFVESSNAQRNEPICGAMALSFNYSLVGRNIFCKDCVIK